MANIENSGKNKKRHLKAIKINHLFSRFKLQGLGVLFHKILGSMSTSDSMGEGPPNKKARFGEESGKKHTDFNAFLDNFKCVFHILFPRFMTKLR